MNIKKILAVMVVAVVVFAGFAVAGMLSAPDRIKNTDTLISKAEPHKVKDADMQISTSESQSSDKATMNETKDIVLSVTTDIETDTPEDTFEIVQNSGAVIDKPASESSSVNERPSSSEETEGENDATNADEKIESETPVEFEEIRLPIVPF